jgi:ferredoxin-NADP reductase
VDAETIDFCIAVVEGGRFSAAIQTADTGTRFQLSGPRGHFVFQGPLNPAVFVATGTGVAPFVAFCRSGVGAAFLLHGVGSPDRLIYRDILQPAVDNYVPCISRPAEAKGNRKRAFPGRVTHYLEQQLKTGTYDFYLCGRRAMIRDATAIIDQRFGDSRLFIETYD